MSQKRTRANQSLFPEERKRCARRKKKQDTGQNRKTNGKILEKKKRKLRVFIRTWNKKKHVRYGTEKRETKTDGDHRMRCGSWWNLIDSRWSTWRQNWTPRSRQRGTINRCRCVISHLLFIYFFCCCRCLPIFKPPTSVYPRADRNTTVWREGKIVTRCGFPLHWLLVPAALAVALVVVDCRRWNMWQGNGRVKGEPHVKRREPDGRLHETHRGVVFTSFCCYRLFYF